MNQSKGIGPVVATSLFLVVAVVAVFGFQTWWGVYSSQTLSDLEEKGDASSNRFQVERVIGDKLYINSGAVRNLTSLKIMDAGGNEMCGFSDLGLSDLDSDSDLIAWYRLDDGDSTINDYSENGNDGVLYGDTRILLSFDEDNSTHALDDTAYGNNGTLQGVTLNETGCISGNCYDFDGTDDYIGFGDRGDLDFDFGDFTLSAWIKTTDNVSVGENRIITKKGDGNLPGYSLALDIFGGSYSRVRVNLANSTDSQTFLSDVVSQEDISDDRWHNIVIVVDRDDLEVRYFLDGESYGNSDAITLTGSINTSEEFFVGAQGQAGPKYFFNGSIDEVSIYSKALSTSEVSDLYDSRFAKFLEFKESKIDQSVDFDGVDDYIEINNDFGTLTENFTLVVFMAPEDSGGDYQWFFGTEDSCGITYPNARGFQLALNEDRFQIISGNGTAADYDYSSEIGYGDSYLVIGSFSEGNSSIYVNAQEEVSIARNVVIEDGVNARIGMIPTGGCGGRYYAGEIDEIRVYNRSLTQSELETLYLYSFRKNGVGINAIDISSCSLSKGQRYEIVAISDDVIIQEEEIRG